MVGSGTVIIGFVAWFQIFNWKDRFKGEREKKREKKKRKEKKKKGSMEKDLKKKIVIVDSRACVEKAKRNNAVGKIT